MIIIIVAYYNLNKKNRHYIFSAFKFLDKELLYQGKISTEFFFISYHFWGAYLLLFKFKRKVFIIHPLLWKFLAESDYSNEHQLGHALGSFYRFPRTEDGPLSCPFGPQVVPPLPCQRFLNLWLTSGYVFFLVFSNIWSEILGLKWKCCCWDLCRLQMFVTGNSRNET